MKQKRRNKMSTFHAKEYLERLKQDIEYDGEEKTSVNCRGLIIILEELVKELDRED